MELDHKQRRLIDSWLERSSANGDEYGRFIAAWIAFNAFCYSQFAKQASRRRPDISDDRGLVSVTGFLPAKGSVELRANGRVRIRIDEPGRIQIDIRERYSEEVVFSEFARKFQTPFGTWLADIAFRKAHEQFLSALTRPRGCYVVNMLNAEQFTDEAPIGELAEKNVVVVVTDPDKLVQIVDALYQVRCNVFHGEKVPGAVNDDRIIKAARPILVELLTRALKTEPEQAALF